MAATTMVGAARDASMEEKKLAYFSSINSMANKIMQEREKIKEKYGSAWDNMTPTEQDSAIDNVMMDPHIRARYGMHRVDREEVVCYPKLLIQTGQKIVHFGEEDITWQDEHSAPFSWETKSQLEFSLTSGAPEQSISSSVADPKPSKPAQNNQMTKVAPSSKSSNNDTSGRREEESSFWKISLERSRLEGEKSDFQSLTPSQIKSMEKGEKPLPSYLRTEAEDPPRPTKQRAARPPAPPPPIPVSVTPAAGIAPPAAISVLPATPASVPSSVAGWERAQSTLPSVSPLDDVFSPGLALKPPAGHSSTAREEEKIDTSMGSSPTFSQLTGGNMVKTGFDFLDNW
ncbi:uncharacterized protein C1orf198 homolog [Alosa pseudoharengus]|uniref:uncharacterized protein C1orf198 homolog n=1 Tax=Alosa pseudoharengus TaxID=34774 RepID=UPI003F8B844A